jgi:superfamily II DNA helicase RecQ
MLFRFFSVPALDPDHGSEEVTAFLSNHRVIGVDRQLVANGSHSFWAICITYTSSEARTAGSTGKRPNKDYREILSEADFAVFARLRTLRLELAKREPGLPAYALFTNDQLATMVRERITTPAALAALPGVGQARVDKYGEAFLAILRQTAGPADAGA